MTKRAIVAITALAIEMGLSASGAPAREPEGPVRTAEQVLQASLEGTDSWERWFALRALQGVRWPRLADEVRPLAEAPGLYEQSLALGFLSDNLEEADLFLDALDSPHRPVRLRALQKLAQLDDPRAAPPLRRILRSDPDPNLRAHAARGLARHDDERTRVALRGALREDVSPLVREECVRSLAALNDPDLPLILADEARAATGRERLVVIRQIRASGRPSLISSLASWLEDGDPEVRTAAAAAVLVLAASADGEGAP